MNREALKIISDELHHIFFHARKCGEAFRPPQIELMPNTLHVYHLVQVIGLKIKTFSFDLQLSFTLSQLCFAALIIIFTTRLLKSPITSCTKWRFRNRFHLFIFVLATNRLCAWLCKKSRDSTSRRWPIPACQYLCVIRKWSGRCDKTIKLKRLRKANSKSMIFIWFQTVSFGFTGAVALNFRFHVPDLSTNEHLSKAD